MWFRKNKKKYYAFILQKRRGSYERIGKKRINRTSATFKYKGKVFPINIEVNTYTRGLKEFFFYDFKKKQQLLIDKHIAQNTDADIYDIVHGIKLIKQLSANLGDSGWKMNLITLIVGIALGGGFGFIISGYV